MALQVPVTTRSVLEFYESNPQPTVDYEIAGKLSGLHQADGQTDAERKGAWAEASAFNFHTMENGSPWGTYFGPMFNRSNAHAPG